MFCEVALQHMLEITEDIHLPVPVTEKQDSNRKKKVLFSQLEVRKTQCHDCTTSYVGIFEVL